MENQLNTPSRNDRSTLGRILTFLSIFAILMSIIGKAIVGLPKIIDTYSRTEGIVSYGDEFLRIFPERKSFSIGMKFKFRSGQTSQGIHRVEAEMTDSINKSILLLATNLSDGKKKREFNSINCPKDSMTVCKILFSIKGDRKIVLSAGKVYWVTFRSFPYDNGPPIVNHYKFDLSEKQIRLLARMNVTTVTLSELKN